MSRRLRDEEGNAYAMALLTEFLILIGQAKRRMMPMVCYRCLGCVLVLLSFEGGGGERESNKLWNSRFFRVSSLIPT